MKTIRTVVGLALAATPAALAQTTAIDTFGPNNSFNTLQSHEVRGPDSPAGAPVARGHLFLSEASGAVTEIFTALRHADGTNNYTVQLRQGDANQVGFVLEEWTGVQASTNIQNPVISIPAGGTTQLTAGQTFWVTVIPQGSATGRWHHNDQGFSGFTATSSNQGFTFFLINTTPHPAIRVTLDGPAPCYPDCNEDGVLDFFDFLCFQNAFLAQDPYADCDENGVFDFFDFLCFQNEFLAGCP